MIKYRIVHPKSIRSGILSGYQRYTETTLTKLYKDGKLVDHETYFVDEWDEGKLRTIELYMKEKQNRTVLAKVGNQVVGFAVLDIRIFDGYMNMPYIHTDNRYRGQGIGRELMLLISKTAKDHGAKKLYISAHPDVRAQAFYEKMGCVLAKKINKELYEIEPYDIQLERSLDYKDIMMRKINHEFQQHNRVSSTLLNKLIPRVYQVMPKEDLEFIKAVKSLLISDHRSFFSMGTLLLKKRGTVVDEKYLDIYEDILLNHIHGWGQVDQYCYRVLGPIFNKNYALFTKLQAWSKSDNKDVRRTSLVAMLTSRQRITCTYPIEHVMELVEILKDDEDFHVKKGVGWVLKCAYLEYPRQVVDFLKENHKNLDRIIFRYALEHMEKELKQKLMKL